MSLSANCESTGLHNFKDLESMQTSNTAVMADLYHLRTAAQTIIIRNMNFDSFDAHDAVLNRALDNLLELLPEHQKLAKDY